MKFKERLRSGVILSLIISISLGMTNLSSNAFYETSETPKASPQAGVNVLGASYSKPYKEANNTYTDGGTTYYLLTTDASKTGLQGQQYTYHNPTTNADETYTLAGVYVVPADGKFNFRTQNASDGQKLFSDNHTVFVEPGTYTDTDYTGYTNLSKVNLSLVGTDYSKTAVLKREPYPTDYSTAAIRDLMERYNFMHKNLYFENVTFDGGNKDLLPLGDKKQGIGKNRGEYLIFVTGENAPWDGTDGFVFRNITITNVGADNSTQPGGLFSGYLIRKNSAINVYQSNGQHNFENVFIDDVKTKSGYTIVGLNDTKENYFKDITITGKNAHANAFSIKVEENRGGVASGGVSDVVFKNKLNLPSGDKLKDNVYVQSNLFRSVSFIPTESSGSYNAAENYKYAVYNKNNGSSGTPNSLVYQELGTIDTDMPSIVQGKTTIVGWNAFTLGILDLRDNTWVVRETGNPEELTNQIKNVLDVINGNGSNVPSYTIKIIAKNDKIGSFNVLNNTNSIKIVAVSDKDEMVDVDKLGDKKITFSKEGIIDLTGSDGIKLHNFNFDKEAKYTMHETISGITGNIVPTDPAEALNISGYPKYDSYKPSAPKEPTIKNSKQDTFINCRFTELAKEIKVLNAPTELSVGSTSTPTADVTEGYTQTGIAVDKEYVDDKTIKWFSSDSSVAQVDEKTGEITAKKAGSVTIFAKAMDVNNSGEVEKPFASFNFKVVVNKYDVTYKYESITSGKTMPSTIIPPTATKEDDGTTITPSAPKQTEYDVAGGKWKFIGWEPSTQKISGKAIEFVGKWEFIAISSGGSGSGGSGGGNSIRATAVLANGEKYTDVLTATVLANERKCPILLTETDNITKETLDELHRRGIGDVIISGGTDSVSKKVVDQLKGFNVVRYSGADRYGTAREIGNQVRKLTGNLKESVLVDGTNFPDVITISALATQRRVPILVTNPSKLTKTTENTVKDWKLSKVTIGGQISSVSQDVEKSVRIAVNSVDRIGGADRYETASLIGKEVRKLTGNLKEMILVDGTNFPDGITVNSLAAKFKAPIHLTKPSVLTSITANDISSWEINSILVAGGTSSVSNNIYDNLKIKNKERISGVNRYSTAVKISQRLDLILPIGMR